MACKINIIYLTIYILNEMLEDTRLKLLLDLDIK